MLHTVYFSLGANIGDRERQLRDAISKINERVGEVSACSSFLETEPWGFVSPHPFINCCVRCLTELSPTDVLQVTQQIERDMGREQKSTDGQYHDRVIDIDILLYDDWHVTEPDLVIPHPHIQEREFVLKPLKEIWE